MRPDLISPRPLRRGFQSYVDPCHTNEISKADPFNMCGIEEIFKSIWKAGTAALSPSSFESAKTQLAPPKAVAGTVAAKPKASSFTGVGALSGHLPDVQHRSTVSTPGHKLATARVAHDYHAGEYHRHNVTANDQSLPREHRVQASQIRDEHQRLALNAKKVANRYESAGVQDTPKHHADLTLHYEQNKKDPKYSGGQLHPLQPSGSSLRRIHNEKSGSNWDQHYGAPEGIAWHKPEVREEYRQHLNKLQGIGTSTAERKQQGAASLLQAMTGREPSEKEKFMSRIEEAGKSLDQLMEMSKALWTPEAKNIPEPKNASQKRSLQSNAAHSLVTHHRLRNVGDHSGAKKWEDHAHRLVKLAGAGPSKKMMQGYVDLTGRVAKEEAHTGFKLPQEEHQAAKQAMSHPLVDYKPHPIQKVAKSCEIRADLIGPRPLKRAIKKSGQVIGHTTSGKAVHKVHADQSDHPSYKHSQTGQPLKTLYGQTALGHEHEAPKLVNHEGRNYVKAAHNSDTGTVSYHEHDPGRHLVDHKTGVAVHASEIPPQHMKEMGAKGKGFVVHGNTPADATPTGSLPREINDSAHGKLRVRGHNSDTNTTIYHQADKNSGWEKGLGKSFVGLRKAGAPASGNQEFVGYHIYIPHSSKYPAMVSDQHGVKLNLHSDGSVRHPKTGEVHGRYSWHKETGPGEGRKILSVEPTKAKQHDIFEHGE